MKDHDVKLINLLKLLLEENYGNKITPTLATGILVLLHHTASQSPADVRTSDTQS